MTAAPEVKVEPNEEQLAVKTEDPAPPAQQQQQQQLTIPDLPKEVLHRILSMTTEQLSFTSRYRNLKSTALVAKAWRGPSQELLCRDAVFHSVATIQRWLESDACSRYPSERIEIDGRYGQVDAHSAELVVARSTGVRRLRLDFIRGISSRILTTPNLAGVTHLTIHCKVYCDPVPITLPFQLRRLVIAGQYHPLALIHALFASSSATLVDLVTNMLQGQSMEERELLYRSIGSLQRLQRLSDFGRNSDETMNLLPHLPTSLEEFNSCLPDKHRVIQFAADLNLDHMPHFNRLTMTYLTRPDLLSTAPGVQLIKTCEQREISLGFGCDRDYLREELMLLKTDALKPYY